MRKTTFKGQLLRLNNTRETLAVKLSTKMRDKVILQSIYSLSLRAMFYSVGYLAPAADCAAGSSVWRVVRGTMLCTASQQLLLGQGQGWATPFYNQKIRISDFKRF